MDDLQKLIAERKALDAKIKEMQHRSFIVNNVKLVYESSYRYGGSAWKLMIRKIESDDLKYKHRDSPKHYANVLAFSSRNDCLDQIDLLIQDLTALRNGFILLDESDEEDP